MFEDCCEQDNFTISDENFTENAFSEHYPCYYEEGDCNLKGYKGEGYYEVKGIGTIVSGPYNTIEECEQIIIEQLENN